MKKWFFVLVAAIALTGCASGPKFSTVQNSIPQVEDGHARIYFYRTSHFGGAYQPTVYIDKEAYGKAYLEGVFFKDLPPGQYRISTSLSQGNNVDLNLAAGDLAYIKFVYRIGMAVYPTLVEPAVGEEEILRMAYVENPNKTEQ